MNDVFNRILKLALRTGDKVIVIDPSQNKPYVMMDFEDYEKLIYRPTRGLCDRVLEQNQHKSCAHTKECFVDKKQTDEPRIASALAGSDPLEPDSAFSASVGMDRKIKFPETQQTEFKDNLTSDRLETEEYFYLESV